MKIRAFEYTGVLFKPSFLPVPLTDDWPKNNERLKENIQENLILAVRDGKSTHIFYSSRSIDTCVKKD